MNSYQLISTPSQAQAALSSVNRSRYVSGCNRMPELGIYQNALQMASKQRKETSRSLVVAHCDEDLSWIARVPIPSEKVHVYSKGKDTHGTPLPNIGREFHTYFTHILKHYGHFDKVTFFLQGWPFDRSTGILPALSWLSHVRYVEFGTDILDTGVIGEQLQRFWLTLFRSDVGWEGMRELPEGWCFRANVQFAACDAILEKHPIKFYERCLDFLENGIPAEGIQAESVPYLLEQVWPFIYY